MTPKILQFLQGVVEKGADKWSAICPAHDDQTPSLDIELGDDGKTLLCCRAGCDNADILRAVDQPYSILFPQSAAPTGAEPTATFEYRDERKTLLYQVRRFDKPDGKKEFRQRRPDFNGGWLAGKGCMTGVRRVLFRLPELLAAGLSEPVLICEGEKAALAAVRLGFTATTASEGALKWANKKDRREIGYAQSLAGRHVVLLPDNDDIGREHVDQVGTSIKAAAASIRLLALPGLPEKGDVYDWAAAGGTAEQLRQLIADAPPWAPASTGAKPSKSKTVDPKGRDPLCLLLPEARTDLANARRLVKWHGEDLRFCHPWKQFLCWDQSRWLPDGTAEATRLAAKVSDRLWLESRALKEKEKLGDGEFKTLVEFAAKSASRASIANMLTLASAEAGMPIVPAEMDVDPWLLNCLNGTLDLRTGKIRDAKREDLLTKLCPTLFDPEADCPTWESFLHRVFNGDESIVEFIQCYYGWCLTGDVSDHVLVVLHGNGSNGKSTMLAALQHVLGDDYSMQANPSLLMRKPGNEHPTALADLHGKRLVSTIETGDGATFDEELVKTLTGGDIIRARRLYEDHWQFKPSHKITLATNHKPAIKGTDNAIWRRLRLVPFSVQFWNPEKGEDGPEDLRQDKRLGDKLKAEASGILAWLVRGCLRWQRSGLRSPQSILAETDAYRHEQDVVQSFVTECCESKPSNPNYRVKASRLFEAFDRWAGPGRRMNQTRFGRRMDALGYQNVKDGNVWYLGLWLLDVPVNDRSFDSDSQDSSEAETGNFLTRV